MQVTVVASFDGTGAASIWAYIVAIIAVLATAQHSIATNTRLAEGNGAWEVSAKPGREWHLTQRCPTIANTWHFSIVEQPCSETLLLCIPVSHSIIY